MLKVDAEFGESDDLDIEYVDVARASTMEPIESIDDATKVNDSVCISIAVKLGGKRLIDNILLSI